nr:hypothetical transcript [Hymenolepis microstoma]
MMISFVGLVFTNHLRICLRHMFARQGRFELLFSIHIPNKNCMQSGFDDSRRIEYIKYLRTIIFFNQNKLCI